VSLRSHQLCTRLLLLLLCILLLLLAWHCFMLR
jgi:hypothetical protein